MIPIDGWNAHELRRAYAARFEHPSVVRAEPRDLTGAASALHARLLRLYQEIGDKEAAAFRDYLGAAVRTASPLLLRMCELEGVDLDAVAGRLGPRGAWPRWLCGSNPHDRWLKSIVGRTNAGPSPLQLAAWHFEQLVHGGLVIQDSPDDGTRFGARVLDRGLEVAAVIGGHRIRTHGREGSVTLRLELPETLMAGLPGRPLDQLVDHPLLAGAGCMVTQAERPSRARTKIRFALDPMPWRVPWARGAGW